MSRRLALLLVVVLSAPALALAADTDPTKRFNAADQRKAVSIVLKRADFAGGWKKVPSSPDSSAEASCPNYDPDQSDLVLTGEAQADFELASGIPSVTSVANVYRTRREALAAWTRSARPALAPCLATILEREIEAAGQKVAITKTGRFAFAKVAPRTLAYRVGLELTVTQAGKTSKVPFTMHMVVLGNGRGDCALIAVGLGNGVPIADLRAFAKLTASRLAAAKL
ncbi:MAG: hypothetical protein ACXWZB_04220 [Gaiellaceae bacterium]